MSTDLNYFFDFISEGVEEIFETLQEVSDLFKYLFSLFPTDVMFFMILVAVFILLGVFLGTISRGD